MSPSLLSLATPRSLYRCHDHANTLRSMPKINAKIQAQTEEVDRLLNALPELPNHNVQHIVRAQLQKFSNGVQRLLEGGSTSNSFLSAWSQLSIDFRDAIQTMKPMFIYTDPSDEKLPEVIDIDDSDSDPTNLTPNSRVNVKRAPGSDFVTPVAQRQQIANGAQANRHPSTPKTKQEDSCPSSPVSQRRIAPLKPLRRSSTAFKEFLNAGKSFMNLAEVRSYIAKHKRPGLPDHIDDAAKEDVCLHAVRPWNLPLERMAQQTFEMLCNAVLGMLDSSLGMYKQTELYRASRRHIQEFLRMHAAEQRTTLDALYSLEAYKLFTINNSAFEIYKVEELKRLQDARRNRRVNCYVDAQARLGRKELTDIARQNARKQVTDDKLGPDPFANEVQLAAYVRGYYKTAGFRFADNVCQTIQGNMFRKIHAEILGLLESHLNLNEGDGKSLYQLNSLASH